ncbi:MAG: DNA topoisomerase IB, partial [Proteobacteria bacterium]|nr:DNA topoisomerase IB [Pseudomonadota bacterium]
MSKSQKEFVEAVAREKGLTIVGPEALTVRRQRCGAGFCFRAPSGALLRDRHEIARMKALAVPPAYSDVRFAMDPSAHLQAVGTDAAGRLQYRYHPKWTEVREALKARRLASLAKALPDIERAVARALQAEEVDSAFAAAAVVHLVSRTAIRAGGESYAREHGTRGATTLLKSNVILAEGLVTLQFKAKGGKPVIKEVRDIRLHAAMQSLMALPGRRLFQYRDAEGAVHPVRAADVNAYLCSVAGRRLSLKDFRTLLASAAVLDVLAATEPAPSERARRSQLRSAVTAVAEELANTPTVCRKSYVNEAVVTAFEQGALARLRKPTRSPTKKAEVLARIVARHS